MQETFDKIYEILNKQIPIKPCPICGSEISITENESDSPWIWFTFCCDNSDCGFSYHPRDNDFYPKTSDQFQKNLIINNCIEQVNKRA